MAASEVDCWESLEAPPSLCYGWPGRPGLLAARRRSCIIAGGGVAVAGVRSSCLGRACNGHVNFVKHLYYIPRIIGSYVSNAEPTKTTRVVKLLVGMQ